ncbi:MAG: transglutaminase family protein [Planctomycetota bacterium]
MFIQCGHEVVFELRAPTPMLLQLYIHPTRSQNLNQPEAIRIDPPMPIMDYYDSFGNRCGRILAPAGRLCLSNDNVVFDNGEKDFVHTFAKQHTIGELPVDAMPFLLASRYCEVDRFSDIAFQLFGQTQPGWARVQAICDWVHSNVLFGYQFARPTKTAWDVYTERTGVCRDFQHLAITFCRALNIPARYATGYLGDIGIPALPSPMDFSAWFEVYLDNVWYTMDARFNTPRVGRVLMGRGRDAVDCALTTSFGHAELKSFRVWANELK